MRLQIEYSPIYSGKGYTKVNSAIFADKTASMAERGMYMLLSELQAFVGKNGKTWELTAEGMASIIQESDKTVCKLFHALMDKGYLNMCRKRTRGSFWGGNQWKVYEKEEAAYIMIDNSVFRDELSLKQMGLLGTIQSLHSIQSASIRALNEMLPDSYRSIHARRKELQERGFFECNQENHGCFEYATWNVHAISEQQKMKLQEQFQQKMDEFITRYRLQIRKVVQRRIKQYRSYLKKYKKKLLEKLKHQYAQICNTVTEHKNRYVKSAKKKLLGCRTQTGKSELESG